MTLFAKSAKEEGGRRFRKQHKKIRYLRRNAFVDDPFNVLLVAEVAPAILLGTMAKISCHRKLGNLQLV